MKYELTDTEANLIKDILKTIGRDTALNSQFAVATGYEESDFNNVADAAFTALGNGRLIVEG